MALAERSRGASLPEKVPSRVIIEGVDPEIDEGRFPIKRTPGEEVAVMADIYADGHDVLAAVLRSRYAPAGDWQETPMKDLGNDRWVGRFTVQNLGRYEYTLQAWIDQFASWRKELSKKFTAGQEVSSELLEGAELVRQAAGRAFGADAGWLEKQAEFLEHGGEPAQRVQTALDTALEVVMGRYADRSRGISYGRSLGVTVDRDKARFGAWYEMFPRSAASEPGRHGTLKDCEKRLPYIAAMGFDVLYLPPIHPVGRSFRKGPNNTLTAGPNDPGSPWAIGAPEGGHKAINPQLGTLADFDHLVAAAREQGLEIALDIAFQCSPDHPYVREHPEWFRHRPDGTIKYAENPPKKYQDIYPLDFECADWQALWQELRDVVLFWVGHGVRIFRVDNPHTKPFRFWEWLIRTVQEQHPDTIFLAEAFTRPKVMRYLAKGGFSQSYTYFTWRNSRAELTAYFTELTQNEVREYMRPNLFANTPDILHEFLQWGGRPAFQLRLVLAATLGATYGIYGPPFENCVGKALGRSEEYQDSEKYQVRHWDWDQPSAFRDFITRVNEVRRDNPALQFDHRLRFYPTDNEQLICYGKTSPDLANVILVVVNLDPHHTQSGWVRIPLADLGLTESTTFQVHDLISEARYLWHGESNFVQLDPQVCPAHIFRMRRKIKTERDFDYYL
ncbi:MAG: alpha-1,4-glucan--maltose-1-phosphate maltosyltransferase [Planctomycetes bacterium]|nr:alpha-1,4-glucan--maltose-1-phosphate maltosyltransferase [Planctomycetota bacterium]